MKPTSWVLGLAAALTSTACLSMPPVRMEATPVDYEKLVGKWNGEYNSAALGRRGSIEFKLVAGQNNASGAVVMVPQGSGRPYEVGTLEHQGTGGSMDSKMLTISFVRALGGSITGRLDRYWDPDRNCDALTVFQGRLMDQTIEGTFTTTWNCGSGEATGRWKVARR